MTHLLRKRARQRVNRIDARGANSIKTLLVVNSFRYLRKTCKFKVFKHLELIFESIIQQQTKQQQTSTIANKYKCK